MGTLHYGAQHRFTFDDRSLNHLRSVITAKLLQRESFPFTWESDKGQRTVWITPEAQLVFEFTSDASGRGALNLEWIRVLLNQANTSAGLHLTREPVGS